MDHRQLHGLQVIAIAEGRKEGNVRSVYVDLTTFCVLGLTVNAPSWTHAAFVANRLPGTLAPTTSEPRYVPAIDVRSLEPDALIVNDVTQWSLGVPEEITNDAISLEDLARRSVVAEDGTFIGKIHALLLDPERLSVVRIRVAPGFHRIGITIPVETVRCVTPDQIVVTNSVRQQPFTIRPSSVV